jgi:hypothetical protein
MFSEEDEAGARAVVLVSMVDREESFWLRRN